MDNFSTQLSPLQKVNYQLWLLKNKIDPKYASEDYDMEGYWKKYGEQDQEHGKGVHYTDEFKKPNHLTFSNQSIYSNNSHPGGKWEENNGAWTFTPSIWQIKNNGVKRLIDYFEEGNRTGNEPSKLNLFPITFGGGLSGK